MKSILVAVILGIFANSAWAIGHVITVAQDGSGDFYDPYSAIQSIGFTSASDRYVIDIGPGVYFLGGKQLLLKPYVSIKGAGINSTVIQSFAKAEVSRVGFLGEVSECAVVVVADYSFIEGLSIVNVGVEGDVAEVSCGIFSDGAKRVNILNVSLALSGRSQQKIGLKARDSNFDMRDVVVEVSNPLGVSRGVELNTSRATIRSSNITANSNVGIAQSADARAVMASDSSVYMDDSLVISSGVGFSSGLGDADLDNIRIIARELGIAETSGAENAVFGYGLKISDSNITAAFTNFETPEAIDKGIDFGSNPNVRVLNSQIIGGVKNDPDGVQCLNVFNSQLSLIGC